MFVLGGYVETTIDGGSGIDTFKVGLKNMWIIQEMTVIITKVFH